MNDLSSAVDKSWREIAKLADLKVAANPKATAREFAVSYGFHLASISSNLKEMSSILRMQSYSLEAKAKDLEAVLARGGK